MLTRTTRDEYRFYIYSLDFRRGLLAFAEVSPSPLPDADYAGLTFNCRINGSARGVSRALKRRHALSRTPVALLVKQSYRYLLLAGCAHAEDRG